MESAAFAIEDSAKFKLLLSDAVNSESLELLLLTLNYQFRVLTQKTLDFHCFFSRDTPIYMSVVVRCGA